MSLYLADETVSLLSWISVQESPAVAREDALLTFKDIQGR